MISIFLYEGVPESGKRAGLKILWLSAYASSNLVPLICLGGLASRAPHW